jgi:hypothetical protein
LYKPDLFVEYGVSEGNTTRLIAPYCKTIWGVDKGEVKDPNLVAKDIPNMEAFKMLTY